MYEAAWRSWPLPLLLRTWSRLFFIHYNSRGVLDLSLRREVLPGPWNPDPVYDKKKFVKIIENWYPVRDFQVKFHSFFRQNVWVLDPVYKKSSKIFEFKTLFMSGESKNHTLEGGTSPYSLWEYPYPNYKQMI